jgi:hypothetical protein
MSVSNRITLKHIHSIIKNVFNDRTIMPLGRWKIKDKENSNLVVDYSNEDHCGTCAQYINNKHQEKIDYTNDEYNYLSEFELMNTNIPGGFDKNKKKYNIYYEKML